MLSKPHRLHTKALGFSARSSIRGAKMLFEEMKKLKWAPSRPGARRKRRPRPEPKRLGARPHLLGHNDISPVNT